MLPLRVNRKPQLVRRCFPIFVYFRDSNSNSGISSSNCPQLPIKQLLTKQREENSRAEDDHSLNTDDYLLWKTENEPAEKKSVSFRPRDDEIKLRTRDQALPEYVRIV